MAVRARLTDGATRSKDQFLSELREVKNNLIGNVGKKLALVEEDGTIVYLVEQIRETVVHLQKFSSASPIPEQEVKLQLEILNELAVVLGAVANAGNLALVDLLKSNLAIMLLASISVVHPLATSTFHSHPLLSRYINTKCLPSLARAFRNHTITLGDFVWGHMWGVGVEIKVDPVEPRPGVGLVGDKGKGLEVRSGSAMDVDGGADGEQDREREERVVRLDNVQKQAIEVLSGMYKPRSLEIFSPVLLSDSSPLTLLPMYQMLAHLTVMSWQRNALVDASFDLHSSRMNPTKRPTSALDPDPGPGSSVSVPLLERLVMEVTNRETNVKLKQASLDFLGALCKDEEAISREVCGLLGVQETADVPVDKDSVGVTPVYDKLVGSGSKSNAVAVSAACCAANIIFSSSSKPFTSRQEEMPLFKHLVHLLDQTVEDRIRLCFVISHIMANHQDLQLQACDTNAMTKIIAIVKEVDSDGLKGETENNKARLLEAALLAMTSLAFHHESPKSMIADAGILPITKKALSHPSYGVRAAACQVTRVLSRSTAILRTTLVDSGIADRILELLKEEEKKFSSEQLEMDGFVNAGRDGRRDTVMIAASAAVCNLIIEFSPMQINMIDKGGIDLLVRMCDSPSHATRINALLSLRNMIYKSDFKVKARVMEALTWPTLHRLIEDPSHDLQEQGLALLRNICSEGSEEEIEMMFNGFGEGPLFEVVEKKLANCDPDCLEQLMFVLYNVCLGNERHREAILSRPAVCQGMIKALSNSSPLIKIPAIGCFANLVETNDRHRRPRQDVIARLRPYMLETWLRILITDPTFDIRDKSSRLLNCLEGFTGGR